MSGGKPHGSGKIIFRQTIPINTYEGGFKNGKPHGIGIGTIGGTVRYIGEFKHGKADGVFECTTPDNGTLQLKFKNGDLTEYYLKDPANLSGTMKPVLIRSGEVVLFEENGYGISIRNNDFYEGDFNDGKRHGEGFAFTSRGGFTPWEIERGAYEEITTSYKGGFDKDGDFTRKHGAVTTIHRVKKNGMLLKTASYKEQGYAELGWNDGPAVRKYETGDTLSGNYPKDPDTKVRFFEPDDPALAKELTNQANQPVIATSPIKINVDDLTNPPIGLLKSIYQKLSNIALYINKPIETDVKKTPIKPLSPEDRRGHDDIHGNPEDRASRVVSQTQPPHKKFIIADGALYIKGSLGGIFGSATKRYDLEVASIKTDHDLGVVRVNNGSADLTLDKVKGVSQELDRALRIERDKVYPKSRQAQQDRRDFPNYPWKGPSGHN